MKTILETDSDFICDIQAPCFQMLLPEEAEIFQLLSRKDLADFAGISTESTVKLLKTFEKDGLIKLHEKDINIIKHDLLLEISRKG